MLPDSECHSDISLHLLIFPFGVDDKVVVSFQHWFINEFLFSYLKPEHRMCSTFTCNKLFLVLNLCFYFFSYFSTTADSCSSDISEL